MFSSPLVQLLLGLGIAALLGGAGFLFVLQGARPWSPEVDLMPADSDGDERTGVVGVDVDGEGNYTIEEVPVTEGSSVVSPTLDRHIVFPDSFPPEARTIVQERIEELVRLLKIDPTSFENWLDLAIQWKTINDFEGAREIWEFLNTAAPENSISFTNLGNLYHLELKDFPKAEENFKRAIANSPQNIQAYTGLHELYRYSYKQNSTAAEDILTEGLKLLPKNLTLLMTLASYYKAEGRVSEARATFEEALVEARASENEGLTAMIENELKALQ